MNTPEEVLVGIDWLLKAMAEWNEEMVPCTWEIITDDAAKTVTVDWTFNEIDDDAGAEKPFQHLDVFTFDEVVHGVKAASPIAKLHKDVAMYWAFEIAVEIIRNAKNN